MYIHISLCFMRYGPRLDLLSAWSLERGCRQEGNISNGGETMFAKSAVSF